MRLVSERSICLKKFEYSETSQILTLLSRGEGLIRVIAKGAHRRTKAGASKFDGGIDLLECGQAVFTVDPNRELGTLTEWKLIDGRPGLRRQLRTLYLGLTAAEMVDSLINEHDPHPEIFDRLDQCLAALGTPRAEEHFLWFLLELLRGTGYLPELSRCVSCRRMIGDRENPGFAVNRGGVVCANCAASFPERLSLDGRLLRLAQSMLRLSELPTIAVADVAPVPPADSPDGPVLPPVPLPTPPPHVPRLPQLTRHQTDPLNRILSQHVEHTLGRRLRMGRYLLPRAQRANRAGV